MDYIQCTIYKTISFVFKPKVFWMLHLNDHLYTKLMCLFVDSEFSGSHYKFRTSFNTFTAFHLLELCLATINGSFTRVGVHPCLLLPEKSFLYHIIQLCDSVKLHPTSPSPPNQTPNAMLIFFNHALTPIQCNVPMHMQCDAPLHVISCPIACYIMPHV